MEALRRQCFDRDKGVCQICGFPAPWDGPFYIKGDLCHIRHKSVGGSDVLDNVYWGHHRCHMQKHNGEI